WVRTIVHAVAVSEPISVRCGPRSVGASALPEPRYFHRFVRDYQSEDRSAGVCSQSAEESAVHGLTGYEPLARDLFPDPAVPYINHIWLLPNAVVLNERAHSST